jgi:hypothetical protein
VNGLHGALAHTAVTKARDYVQESATILNHKIKESRVKVHQNIKFFAFNLDVISVSGETRIVR